MAAQVELVYLETILKRRTKYEIPSGTKPKVITGQQLKIGKEPVFLRFLIVVNRRLEIQQQLQGILFHLVDELSVGISGQYDQSMIGGIIHENNGRLLLTQLVKMRLTRVRVKEEEMTRFSEEAI
ncbi:MAG: hypothetical protein KDC61_09765 [Saprospiraceae bacterium]|nr:hypothetical protein [Saprospiraceae bacterium]MCB9355596.1 hypothetical protein [Lewinellaceae bacterium]